MVHIKAFIFFFVTFLFLMCLTAENMKSTVFFNAFRGLGFCFLWYYHMFYFSFFIHCLVDFQPNKIVETVNYMCLANWQTD